MSLVKAQPKEAFTWGEPGIYLQILVFNPLVIKWKKMIMTSQISLKFGSVQVSVFRQDPFVRTDWAHGAYSLK
jgi:hypothetical protein